MAYAKHAELMKLVVFRIGRTHRYLVCLMYLGAFAFAVSDEIQTVAKARKELARIARLIRKRRAEVWQRWNNVADDIRAMVKENTDEPP